MPGGDEDNPIEIDSTDSEEEASNEPVPILEVETNVKYESERKRDDSDGTSHEETDHNSDDDRDDDYANGKSSDEDDDRTIHESFGNSPIAVKSKNPMWGGIESMAEIEKSPYEGEECAEVGEDCFEELRTFMNLHGNEGQIDPKLEALLGSKLARALCKAHFEIGKSGMLFSVNWRDGKIRESEFGWLQQRQLLLCLHEQRFARAGTQDLQSVARNLDCTGLVLEAMKMWNLQDEYPNLVISKKEDSFNFYRLKKQSLKCEIFVARTYAALEILNQIDDISSSRNLMTKIRQCLAIMSTNVRATHAGLTKPLDESDKGTEPRSSPDGSHHVGELKATKSPRNRELKSDKVIDGDKSRSFTPVNSSVINQKPAKIQQRKPKAVNRENRKRKEKVPHPSGGRKGKRKVPKTNDREESLIQYFNHLNRQAQEVTQMMAFFQTQLHDHRTLLREEIREDIEKEKKTKNKH